MTTGSNVYTLDIVYHNTIIGHLKLDKDTDNLELTYTKEWVVDGFPLSPHLKFNHKIESSTVRKYLQNLLPENQGLDCLIDYLAVSRKNVFALIGGIGVDTSGAIMFVLNFSRGKVATTFRPIEDAVLIMRLSEPTLWAMEMWDQKPRLSVAGVQSKINVLAIDGQLGLGEGDLCSTHIIKFEKDNQQHLVINEFMTMNLARLAGLDVANVQLKYFDKYPALLVERFDRKLFDGKVKRRHIIDGCQACNMSVDNKYERNLGKQRDVQHIRDGVSLPRLFQLTQQCKNPIAAKLTLLHWVLFNICIYNGDSHGKNFSFFVTKEGLEPTPLYDLVNVRMYPEFEQDLAMAVGSEFDSDSINAYQLVDFADDCGINKKVLQRSLQTLTQAILSNIDNAINTVEAKSQSQRNYINSYREIVISRCNHLLEQSYIIPEIEL